MSTQQFIENTTWKLANYLDIAMEAAQTPAKSKAEELVRLDLEIAILKHLKTIEAIAGELLEDISSFCEQGTPEALYSVRSRLERYQNATTPD